MAWPRWLTKAFNPRTFSLTDPALGRVLTGGVDAPSGKAVSADTALNLAGVWACVQLISQTIATLPFMVFEQDADGDRTVASDHPLYSLLHDQPNADQTAIEFWEAMIACALLWGNGYARLDRNGVGDPISLALLEPARMGARRQPDGSILYTYKPYNAPLEEFTEDALFHLKGWSPTGLLGLSVVGYARTSLGTAMAADETAAKFFANGLSGTSVVFEAAGAAANRTMNKEQRDRFEAKLTQYTGSTNASKAMVLEAGFTARVLSLSPDDAQLLSTREFSVDEICRWFRVPAWMIGHMTKTTSWGSGLEQQMIGFLNFTLMPWIKRIEQRVKMSLIKPADRGRVFAEINVDGLLRGDSAARAALYAVLLQNGVAERDWVRRKENLPKYKGEGGDALTVQSNLIKLDDLGKQSPAQTPEGFGHLATPQDQPAKPPVGQ